MVQYNSGNYDKYMSRNLLKRSMVKRLNKKIVSNISEMAKNIGTENVKLKILDAGCGEGFITDLLYHNLENAEFTGVDFTEEALVIAQQINKRIHFVQGDIYEMPFEDLSFDIVICTEVLEHLEDPEKAVLELKRLAREYILLTVPNEPWFCMGNLIALKNVSRWGNPVDHINHWTFGAFKRFVSIRLGGAFRFDRSFPWSIAEWRREREL
ncbi:MAG: methyltransferase domain-containing protein [Hungatella sp.]|nr:methyltransferase domain-containing protein [Hungatella sp.]